MLEKYGRLELPSLQQITIVCAILRAGMSPGYYQLCWKSRAFRVAKATLTMLPKLPPSIQICRHMAEYKRVWLEVLKYQEPKELLSTELVSQSLRFLASSDEVWAQYARITSPLQSSIKALCRNQLPVPTFLAYFKYSNLTIVDLYTSTSTVQKLTPPFHPSSYGAWVSLPKKVFYCGGIARKDGQRNYVASSFLIDITTFEVQQLGEMHKTRAGAGIVYCKGQVYVFGGDNENKQGAEFGNLRECEKLVVALGVWQRLPDMASARRSFTPFLQKEKIYIAGGGGANNLVEVFNLNNDSFLPSPFTIPFTDRLATCLVFGEQLVTLSDGELVVQHITSGVQLDKKRIGTTYWYSPGGTVTYLGEVYFSPYYWPDVFKIGSGLAIALSEIQF